MIEELKKYIDADEFVGKEITEELINTLLIEGRVKFPFKDTTSPSAVSQSDKDRDPGDDNQNKTDDDILNNIQQLEEMTKLLEDMRDDMLKDMNIPPLNKSISDAAKRLGSKDGNITKDIFDKAEVILDDFVREVDKTGTVSPLAALTGNGRIDGPFMDCPGFSKRMMDDWNIKRSSSPSDTDILESHKTNVSEAEDDFKQKMRQMFRYIFADLWWNQIWSRMVIFFLEQVEKFIGKPIDTPFLIFRWKRLRRENYMQYGPIHKALNKVKIQLLCRVPRRNWEDYNPDEEISIWEANRNRRRGQPAGRFISLRDLCNRDDDWDDCPEDEDDDGDNTDVEKKDDWDDASDSIENQFNESDDDIGADCNPFDFSGIKPTDFSGPGSSSACIEAAKTVMDAAYNDALNATHFENEEASGKLVEAIMQGNLGDIQNANQ